MGLPDRSTLTVSLAAVGALADPRGPTRVTPKRGEPSHSIRPLDGLVDSFDRATG